MNPKILRRAAAKLRKGEADPALSDTLHEYARALEERAPLQKAAKKGGQARLFFAESQ